MKALLLRKVQTSDGCRLATDVWLPDGPGPFPVLLTRTPYGRSGRLGAARTYTGWGYACVVQDTRGKFDSGGDFRPLIYEADDGQDTVDWVANQKWCNGRIGMVGKSYLGIVQVPAAAGGHEALRCIVPGVAPASFFTDWIRYDGCFALANAVRWSMTHAVCPTRPVVDHFTWEELYKLPTLDAIFDRAGYRCDELVEWVERDRYDDYWRQVNQHRMYEGVKAAGLHVGGWFDHLTRGQFDAYAGIRARGATPQASSRQRLLIGPWGHSTIGKQTYGDWDFGTEAALDVQFHERRFLDLHLKEINDGITDEPPVKVFLMGENRWVHFSDWPPPETEPQRWYLRSNGGANTLAGDGRLERNAPGPSNPDKYTYDPADPVPTLGGPIYWGLAKAGPVEQRPILGRQDVLYYGSGRLEKPTAVVGEVTVNLWVASSAPDTDFIAKLCVVEPHGRITCLSIGSMRCRFRKGWTEWNELERGVPNEITIRLGHIAYVFPEGSRIALVITSSSFPRILPHHNTMAPAWRESSPQSATQQVFHDADHPSRLDLPVLPV